MNELVTGDTSTQTWLQRKMIAIHRWHKKLHVITLKSQPFPFRRAPSAEKKEKLFMKNVK